ncbi:MAG: endolytic transglycosylase MltG [Lachnospiraceae bacterium]|nr:endolytic transglycosylase MltG [Lachnospiraceae bacterium]
MAKQSATSKAVLNVLSTFIRLVLNLIFYGVVAILLIKAGQYAYTFTYDVFGANTMSEAPGRQVEVKILKGESTMSVAEKLERNKLINDKNAFYMKAKLLGTNIMPGTFVLSDAMTYEEILDTISDATLSIEPVEEETSAAETTKATQEEAGKETSGSDNASE